MYWGCGPQPAVLVCGRSACCQVYKIELATFTFTVAYLPVWNGPFPTWLFVWEL